MPYQLKYEHNTNEYNLDRKTGQQVITGSFWALRTETSVSNTEKRVKPVDLFAGGTTRSWSTEKYMDTLCQIQSTEFSLAYRRSSSILGAGVWYSMPNLDLSKMYEKLRAKIKSENLNLAMACAEYRATCGMFAGAAKDIVKAFRIVRGGRAFEEFIRILQEPKNRTEKRIANRWLEVQYGLLPTVSDLHGAVDALATRINDGIPIYVTQTVRESHRFFQQAPQGSRVNTHELSGIGRARYVIRQPNLKGLTQLGFTNPGLLAWELIPYSFVFDKIIPIGSYLASLDALVGVENFSWYFSKKDTYRFRANAFGSHTITGTAITRYAPSSNLPMPRLGYQPSQSLKFVLNGLALLSQQRGGFIAKR